MNDRVWVVLEIGRETKIVRVFTNPDSAGIEKTNREIRQNLEGQFPLKRYEVEAHVVHNQVV